MLKTKSLFKQIVSFTIGSGLGLLIDLAGFELFSLFVRADFANSLSSIIAILFVYFFFTRFTFLVKPKFQTFIPFIAWYVLTIPIFSFLIYQISAEFHLLPIIAKLSIVPLSFSSNYAFNKILFSLNIRNPFSNNSEDLNSTNSSERS